MPTSITVPTGERTKSIKFGAPYSPSQTFNPDKEKFFQCSTRLAGLDITVNTGPTPDEVTVAPGCFIQRGIIVDITVAQLVQVPSPISFPIFLVAENANEVFNSTVTIQFTTTPAADSVIIAEFQTGPITVFTQPLNASICNLRDEIELINKLIINRERQVAGVGQTIFTLPAGKEYVLGANKIWVFKDKVKLDITADYSETDPNTITLTSPTSGGEILEFLIFQSEPPITSLALTNLTDVTGDLANAIRDTLVLRVALATAANPLATIADVTAAAAPIESKDEGGSIEANTLSVDYTGVGVTASSLGGNAIDVNVEGAFANIKKTLLLAGSFAAAAPGNVFFLVETVPPATFDHIYIHELFGGALGAGTPPPGGSGLLVDGSVIHETGGGVVARVLRLDVIAPGVSAPNLFSFRVHKWLAV